MKSTLLVNLNHFAVYNTYGSHGSFVTPSDCTEGTYCDTTDVYTSSSHLGFCKYTEGVLPEVGQETGKRALMPHNDDWPSLCAANIGTWHRVLFVELLRHWENAATAMRRPKGSHESADPDHVRPHGGTVPQALQNCWTFCLGALNRINEDCCCYYRCKVA